jgi:NADH-quinone oxidoreductase subunit F
MGAFNCHFYTADAAVWPIQGLIKHFRPEMERRIAERAGGSGEMLEAAE